MNKLKITLMMFGVGLVNSLTPISSTAGTTEAGWSTKTTLSMIQGAIGSSQGSTDSAILIWGTLLTVVVAILVWLLVSLNRISRKVKLEGAPESVRSDYEQKATWFQLFRKDDAKKDILMENHEYDGIREYDNNPPAWFNWLFYVTIAFGVIYIFYYHITGAGNLQIEEYQQELAIAEAKYGDLEKQLDFSTYEPLTADAEIQEGKSLYMTNCANCHGDAGEGGIGPNLTDQYWIHGGSFPDIYETIYNGVPEKGMLAWKNVLNKEDIHKVASFVETLKGTDPPDQKDPEGEKYSPSGQASL